MASSATEPGVPEPGGITNTSADREDALCSWPLSWPLKTQLLPLGELLELALARARPDQGEPRPREPGEQELKALDPLLPRQAPHVEEQRRLRVAASGLGAHLLGAELGVKPRRVDPLAPHGHL